MTNQPGKDLLDLIRAAEKDITASLFGMPVRKSPFLSSDEVIIDGPREMFLMNTTTGKGYGIRKDALTMGDLEEAEVLAESVRSSRDLAREVLALRRKRASLERQNKDHVADNRALIERLAAAEARVAELEGREHSPELGGSRSPE